jgi:hypothetical protein
MAGRLKKARADGTLQHLRKSKAWQRLSHRMELDGAKQAEPLEAFFKDVLVRLKDKTVFMMIGLAHYAAMVECAEKFGLDVHFSPDSYFSVGGGAKWANIGDDKIKKIQRLLIEKFEESYGFSEMLTAGPMRMCPAGHFHASPWIIHFVLDPDTSVPYPRVGTQTGRYAIFDLWAQSYWGGFITGDEVTVCWNGECACGRAGPYLHHQITRYSDIRGADDKINCMFTAAAVDEVRQELHGD